MLTVRDLLRDLDVRLLTGERSLHLPVRWVHISELLDPTPWLSGGELLLTTGMQLETTTQARDYVARLADHHLAGLGFGTGFKHAEVPGPLLEVAAEREFPVFEVSYEVPFIAITEAAFTQLVNEQYAVLRRASGRAGAARADRVVRAGPRCAGRRAVDADRGRRDGVRLARRAPAAARVPARDRRAGTRGFAGRDARAGPPPRGARVRALTGRGQPRAGSAGRRRRRAATRERRSGLRVGPPRRGWWRSRTSGPCPTSTA